MHTTFRLIVLILLIVEKLVEVVVINIIYRTGNKLML